MKKILLFLFLLLFSFCSVIIAIDFTPIYDLNDENILFWINKNFKKKSTSPFLKTDNSFTITDETVVISSPTTTATITLPSLSSSEGKTIYIKNLSTNAVTISGTVDGISNPILHTRNEYLKIISDGVNWNIFSRSVNQGTIGLNGDGSFGDQIFGTGIATATITVSQGSNILIMGLVTINGDISLTSRLAIAIFKDGVYVGNTSAFVDNVAADADHYYSLNTQYLDTNVSSGTYRYSVWYRADNIAINNTGGSVIALELK